MYKKSKDWYNGEHVLIVPVGKNMRKAIDMFHAQNPFFYGVLTVKQGDVVKRFRIKDVEAEY